MVRLVVFVAVNVYILGPKASFAFTTPLLLAIALQRPEHTKRRGKSAFRDAVNGVIYFYFIFVNNRTLFKH